MTSPIANQPVEKTIVGLQDPGPPSVLNSETLQQWQSELDDFVTRTRQQLKSLSQSLADCQPSIGQDAREPIAEPAETPAMNRIEIESVETASSITVSSAVETQDENAAIGDRAIDNRTTGDGITGESEAMHSDADPMDRLSAIKLRLAKQIENAS